MRYWIQKLSPMDGRDVYDMLQEIPKNENGFMNGVNGMTFHEFEAWLSTQDESSRKTEIEDGWRVPQTTYWLYVDDKPVGVGKIRHFLTDKLRQEGGNIGYAIMPSARQQGYGKLLLQELLKIARDMGIGEVLITVLNENIPSIKVALSNGGRINKVNEIRHFIWFD